MPALSASRPETVVYDDLGVAVHGQSFATRAVSEDLASRYPPPIAGALNVGLLHTALDGRPGHDPYAPTQLGVLTGKGYDYWALGHVHEREVLASDPWVVFPGNLQGRHARETGPKGATVIEVEDGRVRAVEHRVLDVVRWSQIHVDAEDARSVDDAGKLNISFSIKTEQGRNQNGRSFSYDELQGLGREQTAGGKVSFRLTREAGTFDCEGSFTDGKGSGTFRFTPAAGYLEAMRSRGFDFDKFNSKGNGTVEDRVFAAAIIDVTTRLADDLRARSQGCDPLQEQAGRGDGEGRRATARRDEEREVRHRP